MKASTIRILTLAGGVFASACGNSVPESPYTIPATPLAVSDSTQKSALTQGDVDEVKQQIEVCLNAPSGWVEHPDLTPEFRVFMNKDGMVRDVVLLNQKGQNDPLFLEIAASARRALTDRACQPLKFPPLLYDQWKTFTITFDPS